MAKQKSTTTTTTTAPAAPVTPAQQVFIAMGARPYNPRVTQSSKHEVMGDVVMFNALQAAIAAAPGKRIPRAAALAIVKGVNPKNGAYLGYAVKHNWLALVVEQ